MAGRVVVKIALALICLIAHAQGGDAILFTIPASGRKCVSENLKSGVTVDAKFYIVQTQEANCTISARVTSPSGKVLELFENVIGDSFRLVIDESGKLEVCFWNDGKNLCGDEIMIAFDWKAGFAAEFGDLAEDWDLVKEHVTIRERVSFELEKLELIVSQIHNDLINLKNRDAQMSKMGEKTNRRVAWFGIVSICLSIVVSGFQFCYMKKYFKKKKLI